MIADLRLLTRVKDQLHCSPSSLHSGFSRGRYPFLTRLDPQGRRGRDLWVDINSYNNWAAERGYPARIETGGQR